MRDPMHDRVMTDVPVPMHDRGRTDVQVPMHDRGRTDVLVPMHGRGRTEGMHLTEDLVLTEDRDRTDSAGKMACMLISKKRDLSRFFYVSG